MAVKLTVLWLVLVIAICVAGARWKGRKDEKLHWGSKLKVNAWQSITNEPQQCKLLRPTDHRLVQVWIIEVVSQSVPFLQHFNEAPTSIYLVDSTRI